MANDKVVPFSLRLFAVLCLLLNAEVLSAKPKLAPKPQQIKWLKGEGAAGPLTVISLPKVAGSSGQELYQQFQKKLPEKGLGSEGYLLEVSAARTVIVTAHTWGYLRAYQTLKQLRDKDNNYTYCRIADWPDQAWRGLHVLNSGATKLPLLKRLIEEVLAPAKCNIFIYEIDYGYRFKFHSELWRDQEKLDDIWTLEQVRELVDVCRKHGIMIIPEINCLGHQSWKGPNGDQPHAFLKAHPEFEETPEELYTSDKFYCRSWCPLHPDVNKVVFSLIDEVMNAFQSKYFHVGMDEVFVLGSAKCARCRDKEPAELYAKAVNDLYSHIVTRRKGTMLMWGDRLLHAGRMGYTTWEASLSGTDKAIDMIPKDIIICDWHYNYQDMYSSLQYFTKRGFRVWPSVYNDLRAARSFMNAARARAAKSDKVLGTMATIWTPGHGLVYPLLNITPPADEKVPKGRGQMGEVMKTVLHEAWNYD